jgi:Asp-tRNA(Asn)/Glu-tRNA(Gln) amidotransferase A subunit family amidase
MANRTANRTTIARRTLLKLAPAMVPAMAVAQQGNRPAPPPDVVSKDMLRNALTLAGLEFTDEQLTTMLPEMNRNIPSYQALRKREIPLSTEPAIQFHPNPPRTAIGDAKHAFRPTRTKTRPRRAANRPANLEDLAFAPVTELGPLLKSKQVTSVELTTMYLARLKRYSPKLLCVITLTEDLAMEQARKADEDIRHGRDRGPLHGVPYGAKDLFNTKGILTTWGAEPFQTQVPDNDATVITRLRDAGAVLLAKLSMGALAQGGLWFGGMTKNPWNMEQTSSGSSAGSASATSAGLVGFSIGTETLGSIISPSTRCGVTGLRPTYGRISRAGAMGLSWTMDKVGPICRSVEDCALVLHAAYGPDGQDATVIDVPLAWKPTMPLANLRIGVLQAEFDRQQGESKEVYTAALAALAKAGAQLKPVTLPDMGANSLLIILTAEAATAFDDITRDNRVSQLKGQSPNDWPNTFRSARTIPAVEYLRAQRGRTLLMSQMDKFMADWDVLVSPTGSATLLITNLTGHPQVTVPCGFVNKIPAGLLFTGPLYQEGTPLRAALAFEQATEWHKMHPKVDI